MPTVDVSASDHVRRSRPSPTAASPASVTPGPRPSLRPTQSDNRDGISAAEALAWAPILLRHGAGPGDVLRLMDLGHWGPESSHYQSPGAALEAQPAPTDPAVEAFRQAGIARLPNWNAMRLTANAKSGSPAASADRALPLPIGSVGGLNVCTDRHVASGTLTINLAVHSEPPTRGVATSGIVRLRVGGSDMLGPGPRRDVDVGSRATSPCEPPHVGRQTTSRSLPLSVSKTSPWTGTSFVQA